MLCEDVFSKMVAVVFDGSLNDAWMVGIYGVFAYELTFICELHDLANSKCHEELS